MSKRGEAAGARMLARMMRDEADRARRAVLASPGGRRIDFTGTVRDGYTLRRVRSRWACLACGRDADVTGRAFGAMWTATVGRVTLRRCQTCGPTSTGAR